MRIYYRGFVINEDIRAISYTVFGRRPERSEVAAQSTAQEAMRWIDGEVKRQTVRSQGWNKLQPSLR